MRDLKIKKLILVSLVLLAILIFFVMTQNKSQIFNNLKSFFANRILQLPEEFKKELIEMEEDFKKLRQVNWNGLGSQFLKLIEQIQNFIQKILDKFDKLFEKI